MLHPREDYQRIQDPANLIPEDEPVFLLRAQDKVAAETVRNWAVENERIGGDPILSGLAILHSKKMDAWPVKKLADLPAEPPTPTEQPPQVEQPAEKPFTPEEANEIKENMDSLQTKQESESKPGSGVVSEPAESESKPDSGVVNEPEKSQNESGSGVVE